MGDVVTLPPRDQQKLVWRCDCGCFTFELRADGEAECAQCHAIAGHPGEWRAKLPDTPATVPELEDGAVRITDLNNSHAALRRCLSRAEPDVTAFAVVIQKDGRIGTWGEYIDSAERSDWFDRQVATAKEMLKR